MKRFIFTILLIKLLFTIEIVFTSIEPSYSYKSKGDHYRRMGSEYYGKAISEYEKAIQLRQNYAECYFWIAWILSEKALYEQALMEIELAIKYKDALEYQGEFIDILYLKSEVFFKNKMSNEGKKVLEEILDYLKRFRKQIADLSENVYRQKFGRGFFLLGFFNFKTNSLNEVKKDLFIEAIRLGFRPDLCHYFLSEYYKSINDVNNSETHIESVKRILKQSDKTIEDLKKEISDLNFIKMWSIY